MAARERARDEWRPGPENRRRAASFRGWKVPGFARRFGTAPVDYRAAIQWKPVIVPREAVSFGQDETMGGTFA